MGAGRCHSGIFLPPSSYQIISHKVAKAQRCRALLCALAPLCENQAPFTPPEQEMLIPAIAAIARLRNVDTLAASVWRRKSGIPERR